MIQPHKLEPFNWTQLALLFGIPTLLNWFACQVIMPYLAQNTKLPIEIIYFLSVGLIVLLPMFCAAYLLTSREIGSYKFSNILSRMRINPLTKSDWLWVLGGFIVLSLLSVVIAKLILPIFHIDIKPTFFANMPLAEQHMYILYIWPLFFLLNIFGEEFLWRGYILPRQELLNGKYTWLVHGVFWSLWHLPMGWVLVTTSLPILFLLPAIVQFRKNTSIAIVIHAVFGAMGFISLALGLI